MVMQQSRALILFKVRSIFHEGFATICLGWRTYRPHYSSGFDGRFVKINYGWEGGGVEIQFSKAVETEVSRGGTIFSFCVLHSMNGRGGGWRYNFQKQLKLVWGRGGGTIFSFCVLHSMNDL